MRVEIGSIRQQTSSFGLYRTSAGGDESIVVRRKVADPTDVMHTKSRKLARQRGYMALASQHYAKLTPSQKAITRHQFEIVEYETGHSRTDTKLLSGRQLFISKEIHSLRTTGNQLVLPHEVCIMLVDAAHNPLDGELWLRYPTGEAWKTASKEELALGNWLFSTTPRGHEAYRVYGEADGYTDPDDPEGKQLTEAGLLAYHYHVLTIPGIPVCYNGPLITQWDSQSPGWRQAQHFTPEHSFTLNRMTVTLRRHYAKEYPPLQSFFLAIHHVTLDGYPIEPAIHTAYFDVSLPTWPETVIPLVVMPSIPLASGVKYAWAFGTPPELDPDYPPTCAGSWEGNCWPIGTPTHAWSRWAGGVWTPWQLYSEAFRSYQMFD